MNKTIRHLLIIGSLFFLATCGSESYDNSNTGAISFGLKWDDSMSSSSTYAVLSTNSDVCLDYGIDRISAEVYNSSNAEVASEIWDCSDRRGTISDVPAGTDMRVEIEGSISGSVMWSGKAYNISVTAGQTKDVSVIMSYTRSDTTAPSINVMNPFPGATAVAIDASISVKFNKQMVWPLNDTFTFFSVNNGSVDIPGTVTYDAYTYTLTFTPDSNLSFATTYKATISAEVEDMAGTKMGDEKSWSFTTPRLPDTGQTLCYDSTGNVINCAGTGQDGESSINPMSFTDNGDGTVTDNNTGLMWQQQDDDTTRSQGDAVTYCDALNFATYTDWWLPSRRELLSIVDFGTNTPAIDTTIFPGTDSSYYWSSTENAADSLQAFPINFSGSYSYNTAKSTLYYVRCVRGAQFPDPSFNDNGDETVTDNSTGLMWQQGEDGGSVTWENALTYCEGLSLSTYSDWRLPNVKELESIVDLTKSTDPGIDITYFPGAATYWYATSTTHDQSLTSIWVVSFDTGIGGNGISYGSGPYNVRCVRSTP